MSFLLFTATLLFHRRGRRRLSRLDRGSRPGGDFVAVDLPDRHGRHAPVLNEVYPVLRLPSMSNGLPSIVYE